MARATKTTHGKHDPDDVFVGRWTSPERKAFYTLVANEVGCSLTELIDQGVVEVATRIGLIVDGRPTPAVEEAVAAIGQIYRAALAEKRAKRKALQK